MFPTPHPIALREAVEALVRARGGSLASIAAETGVSLGTVQTWTQRYGWRRASDKAPAPRRARKGKRRLADAARRLDGPALRVALLGHVARQIARFDAALEAEALPDSGRVLRDLGGLKRLLDELSAHHHSEAGGRHGADGHGADAGADAPCPDEADLPALRAQIAARYAAFAGERPDGGLPGEPAGAAAPGAGP